MLGFSRMTHAGTAKVVTVVLSQRGITHRDSKGYSSSRFDVVLDVYPENAAAFRAETHHQFSPLRTPDPGDELTVRCNPDKKVEIDISEDARFNPKIFRKENRRRAGEERERVLGDAPGTPAPARAADDPEIAQLGRFDAEGRARGPGGGGAAD